MKVYVTDLEKTQHELEAVEGWRLMEIIREYNLPIKAECGGACACATCHVYVDDDWMDKIPEMREDEEEMLDSAFDVQDNSRLSCQIILNENLDGLCVTLAKNPD
ncbi:MAG: 2Fe-2S iron-sulfur cluster binding domain-containing protein [Alphaproteobacteria bacterium]|nr:2Fe-2S iron-sulfur cluster binding domain-containing protein [Alphaproteobacteria bacterium]